MPPHQAVQRKAPSSFSTAEATPPSSSGGWPTASLRALNLTPTRTSLAATRRHDFLPPSVSSRPKVPHPLCQLRCPPHRRLRFQQQRRRRLHGSTSRRSRHCSTCSEN